MPTLARPAAKIRVLCVDDCEDIPEMLGRCIAAEPDMESAGSLHSADDLLAEVRRTRADVVLLDMSMPGRDPMVILRELVAACADGGTAAEGGRAWRDVRVIAFSGRSDRESVDRAMDAGAWGFLSKDAEISGVLLAIREVARGNVAFGAGRSPAEFR